MFGPSLSLGKFFGIPVRIHWTFSLLLLWAAFSNFSLSGSLVVAVISMVFLAVIFGCVVLHELGHSLTARHFGIGTRSITLSPLGGIAALEGNPKTWKEEFWITVAGPAVNAVIALLMIPVVIVVAPLSPVLAEPFTTVGSFVLMILVANLMLVFFNLIPAFPMDGGRIFRSLLWTQMDRARATNIAARTGQAFAVMLGVFGLFFSPVLAFISIFVFFAAGVERRSVMMEESLTGMTVHDAMRNSFLTVNDHASVYEALDLALRSGQESFPVMRGETLVGMVDLPKLVEARQRGFGHHPVAKILDTNISPLSPGDGLMKALQAMQKSGRETLPVTLGSRLVGMLPRGSILSMQMFRGA